MPVSQVGTVNSLPNSTFFENFDLLSKKVTTTSEFTAQQHVTVIMELSFSRIYAYM
jgi:hypothetical protein